MPEDVPENDCWSCTVGVVEIYDGNTFSQKVTRGLYGVKIFVWTIVNKIELR